MTAPLIGITTYGQDDERKFPLPREYVDAVRRAGGLPLLLTPGETQIDHLLNSLDGLILAGGGDICPDLYGGVDHDSIYMTDDERDKTELDLTRAAIDRQFPTFGICRGIQVINIVLGGTLHEHLPDVVGEEILHRLPPREPTEHSVTVVCRSRLANLLMGASSSELNNNIEINAASWHHQAIDRVADGFKVVARAPDNTIEAIESDDYPLLIAVQWHPELTAETDELQQRLFDQFVRCCTEASN